MLPVVPEGANLTLAKDQPEFGTLRARMVQYDDGTPSIITEWQFTPNEQRAIAAGANLRFEVLGGRFPPVKLTITEPPVPLAPVQIDHALRLTPNRAAAFLHDHMREDSERRGHDQAAFLALINNAANATNIRPMDAWLFLKNFVEGLKVL